MRMESKGQDMASEGHPHRAGVPGAPGGGWQGSPQQQRGCPQARGPAGEAGLKSPHEVRVSPRCW